MFCNYLPPCRYIDQPIAPPDSDKRPSREEIDKVLIDKTIKIFRIIAQEYRNIPIDDEEDDDGNTIYGLRTYIELFSDLISHRQFGSLYPKALAYLVAHKLKMMGMEGVNADGSQSSEDGLGSLALALRISSASEGETSVSFRSPTSNSSTPSVDSDYELTVYGLEFLKLRRNVVIGIISSGEPVYKNGRRL